jgi:hypothetical protein
VIIDMGTLSKEPTLYHQSVLPINPRFSGYTLLEGIPSLLDGPKWASFQPLQRYCGTLSPAETIDILKYLKSIHNDDIKGVKGSKDGVEIVPFGKMIRILEAQQNSWKPIELP